MSHRLGDVLVKSGRITAEQLQQGLALQKEKGGRIGSAGRIVSTAGGSRQIQLALRWEF